MAKPIARLQKVLKNRIQFLQSLLLIATYQDIIIHPSDGKDVQKKHHTLQKEQIQITMTIISSVRIDDVFKKQFHKLVINIFKTIQPGISIRSLPTGIYRNLYQDYLIFFNQLKQKSIVKFLKLNFQTQIVHGGSMAIFDFYQVLIKFFRIKCMNLVKTILQSRRNSMIKDKVKNIDHIEMDKKKIILSYKTPSNFYFNAKKARTISDRSDKHDQFQIQRQKFQLKCSAKTCTISQFEQRSRKLKTSRKLLKSAGYTRNNNQSPLRLSSRGEKIVIESYKGLHNKKQFSQSPNGLGQRYMEQQQKNSRRSLLIAQKRSISSNFQAYHNNFIEIFTEQWSNYKKLIGIQDLAILQQEDNRKQVGQTKKEIKKQQKKKWQKWVKQKFITSSYARNDTIRIQTQTYAQSYKP